MMPAAFIFTSSVASGVNSYAFVLVLALAGRLMHAGAVPPVLERPPVLAAVAMLYAAQFAAGKIPALNTAWDVAHTVARPLAGGVIGVLAAQHAGASHAATAEAAVLGGVTALAAHVVKTGTRLAARAGPEPVATIALSLLEDAAAGGLAWWWLERPRAATMAAAVALAAGLIVVVGLGTRIRRAWRRHQARHRARQARHRARRARPAAAPGAGIALAPATPGRGRERQPALPAGAGAAVGCGAGGPLRAPRTGRSRSRRRG